MPHESDLPPATVAKYLSSRPSLVRLQEWLRGRRYSFASFPDRTAGRSRPLIVVAYRWPDGARAEAIRLAILRDWPGVPEVSRGVYEEILQRAPALVVVQLRRRNRCGCLGHRHALVTERPFREAHEALGGVAPGEVDIAWARVETWPALPLSDAALDARFFGGSRLAEFHQQQFRLRLLSVILHEINHLVYSSEPEASVRERSLTFYRDALTSYVDSALATLSLTIDRSFSRFE